MPLLGKHTYHMYEVTLQSGDNIRVESIMALDSERAAWQALELSKLRNSTLTNVRLTDEW